jgi:hypothetical protein
MSIMSAFPQERTRKNSRKKIAGITDIRADKSVCVFGSHHGLCPGSVAYVPTGHGAGG